ncbi:MAG TPA: hypothetical protein VKV80_11090 [Streptosporangiaceae bacterium]|nr:hypothetical protein [Streptosporangiaceae bacterium]
MGRVCRMAGLSTRPCYEEFAGREALLIAAYGGIHMLMPAHTAAGGCRMVRAGQI